MSAEVAARMVNEKMRINWQWTELTLNTMDRINRLDTNSKYQRGKVRCLLKLLLGL